MQVTEYNMKWVEPAGLVKFDFPGLKTLTVLYLAVRLLKKRSIDRDLMRTRVYAEPAARQRLEAIIHPLVQQDIWRQAGTAEAAGAPCLVFDVPLLVESKSWQQRVDKILVIDCSPETQISRVQARSGLSRVAVEAIMATQASRAQRLAVADHVILNDGISLEILEEQVRQLAPAFGLSLPHPTAPGTSA